MSVYDERKRVIRLLLKKMFPQLGLLDPMRLRNFAFERGLSVHEKDLEAWDRLGILHPIIKVRRQFTYHLITERQPDGIVQYDPQPLDQESQAGDDVIKVYDTWSFGPEELREWQEREEELVICPSVEAFQPWSELREKDTEMPGEVIETVGLFYHPYQVFRLCEVRRLCQTTFTWSAFNLDHEIWQQWEDWQRRSLKHALEHLETTEVDFLRRSALMLLIEDRYLPRIRGRVTLYGWQPNGIDDWDQWAETFRPDMVLQESGLTVEEVQQIRRDFALQGKRIDPNYAWYCLIRHMTCDQRLQLKKEALLAWDYYEVAEILGLFLEDLTKERQPHVDDLVSWPGGGWKKNIYGVAPEAFDYQKGNALPGILRHYGLDPRFKVLFVVEGESEIEFIKRWCEQQGIDLRVFGIRLFLLGGDELRSPRTPQHLQHARNEGAITVVAIDEEGEQSYRAQQLKEWVKQRLIDKVFDMAELNNPQAVPIGGMLWKPCFEDASFTFEELLEAWIATINAKQVKCVPDKEKLRSAVESFHSLRTGMTWIKSMDQAHKKLHLPFCKSGIARELADRFSNSNKPITLLLQKVIQLGLRARTARYKPSQLPEETT